MTVENRVKAASAANGLGDNLSKGNYAACFGKDDYMSFQSNTLAGVFGVVTLIGTEKVTQSANHASTKGKWKMGAKLGTRPAMIRDGLSNTLALSEVIGYDSPKDGRGAWTSTTMGGSVFTAKYEPNAKTNDVLAVCDTSIKTNTPLDPMACTENTSDGKVWASSRSIHSGGLVNSTMADGSVHTFNDTIDLTVWQGMATRGALEQVTVPD
jgi:prepilin-type processing-associated H-X9-DG protein